MTDSGLQRRLDRERRARQQAEEIAERATRELYENSRLVALLQRAAVAANQASSLEEAVQAVLDDVCKHTGWPVGHFYAVDARGGLAPTTLWHLQHGERFQVFRDVTEAMPLQLGEGLPGRVLATGTPAWITDVTEDTNFPRARQAVEIGVKAAFGFPLLAGEEILGVLEFFAATAIEPNPSLLELMGNIGAQLGRVVERRRAHDALRASEERTRLIVETAHDGFIAVDRDSRIIDWNRQAERIFGWTRDEVLGRRLTETVIPTEHRPAHLDGLQRFLAGGEGAVLGRRIEVIALNRRGEEFPVELTPWALPDLDVGWRFNAFVHDISERKALQHQLEHQALHDPLTALPNRALLLDRLGHALARAPRGGRSIAVLFVDLDRFKSVNDTLGHESGDQLLLAVAERIPSCIRAGDTLARLGGDEFVVLCEDLTDSAGAVKVAERIVDALRQSFSLPQGEVFISGSVGIALGGTTPRTPEELLGDADLAMYRAKERGKATYEVFDPSMRSRLVERMTTERALRRGIGRGELVVHYQPIVAVATGTLSSLEGLVRWEHPEWGLVPPIEFVPVAEDTGLIGALGETVLDQSCAQLREWRHRTGAEGLTMSVNLSIRQLEDPGFAETLVACLARNGLPAECLILEITESVLMRDIEGMIRRLWEVRDSGCRLAIDDFGTGFSSLDRLRRMPVELLKIDKSFVQEIGAEGGTSLVAAIIAMAHSLNLSVVAEGVETPDQLAALRRLGCDHAQGYYLGRPVPARQITALLEQPNLLGDGPSRATAAPIAHE